MATKIKLPNGCFCSQLSVHPQNWDKKDADLKKPWYIHYRFYDPNHPNPKLKALKGMNEFKTLRERQEATRQLLDNETRLLQHLGYNPFTGSCSNVEEGEVSPSTPFLEALKAAQKSVSKGKYTKRDLRDVIVGITKSAKKLRMDSLPISLVSRKYIKRLLNDCCESNHKFNKYRSNLMILFKELIELEATEQEPLGAIKKRKTLKKIRATLSKDERKRINDHLFKKKYYFWRFTHIFFHSGSRETEMLKIRYEDVDLPKQRFKIIVQKDGSAREEYRTIKDIVLPLWKETLNDTQPGQYLFSKFMRPSGTPINPDCISRYWKKYVKGPASKGGLGIKADFYSLKHTNLDEISGLLSARDAAYAAGHKSENTTKVYYLVNEKQREHDRLKKVGNKFA